MATIKDTCKVCGAPMDSSVCHRCGWTPMLFPALVPRAICDFESERMGIANNTLLLTDEKNKLEEKLKNMEQQLEREKQRAQQLAIDLNDTQVKASAMKGEKPKAFLLIKDDRNESVGAVYEGRNTYGCFLGGITDNNHQELNIEGLKPLHFFIEAIGDHYRFFDLIGDVKSGRNPISDRGVSLRNGGKLEIGNDIKITFIITM